MNDTSPYTVKTAESLGEIDPKEWENIFPASSQNYYFFKTAAETLTRQFKFYHIVISRDNRTVCIAPCFTMDYPLDTTVDGAPKKLIAMLRKIFPRFLMMRVFACGSVAGEGKIGIDSTNNPAEIMGQLTTEMKKIARKENASLIAFKDFTHHQNTLFESLTKSGFRKIESYPAVELDIDFKSFDEHVATLSKATRKDLRRKFRKINALTDLKMELRSDVEDCLDEVYNLYLNTFERSAVKFEKVTKEFFGNISKNMNGKTKYFLWKLNGKLAAFDLCVVSGDLLVDEYIGMDYDVAHENHLYFVTFRDIINWCIENGIRKYRSGALNYDPKKRLDFKFLPQYVHAKHSNPIVNFILRLASPLLRPERSDPVLRAIKRK
ncbi:MAG: GNAT family N-acetyltransferase [Candidatus Omnitrophica bacterium]|nr:GNAT family N-acetyltransferase [Candidatus Omnitrophota bacterium]